MSKHRRRRQKRDPRRPSKSRERGASADKAKLLADLARRLGTTESLSEPGSGGEGEVVIGDAVGHARQKEFCRVWNIHRGHERGEAEETGEGSARPDDAGSDEDAVVFDEEDERTAQAMEEHPEYHGFFDDPDSLGDHGVTEDGVNPFAHISMHVIVENQLAQNKPPQVREYLDRFMAVGLSRHEAVHQIARAVSIMIHDILSHNKPHDEVMYLATLEEIAAEVEGGSSSSDGE
ncbi:MAG: DUF1841 family protein [Phycisphaerae bacterium]|nr:DUF1841 family protein [Phycisphaerae bacterium]